MLRRIDMKSLGIMVIALILGLVWATYNLNLVGTVRDDHTVRPLVWVVFATPAALFGGWLLARRYEVGLAAACCFCLYFFSFFVAQRIESVLVDPVQIATNGHTFYFQAVVALHALVGGGLVIWRANQ